MQRMCTPEVEVSAEPISRSVLVGVIIEVDSLLVTSRVSEINLDVAAVKRNNARVHRKYYLAQNLNDVSSLNIAKYITT